jgi:enoyl-[acyl-carrier protein] reductase II
MLRKGNESAGAEALAFIRLGLVKKNRICDLFGIRYPILQGGMLWVAGAELAAAVSNAGALGVISPYAGMDEDGDSQNNLRLQIRQTRRLTDLPFGVNIPLDLPMSGLLIDVILQEKVKIIVTAAGNPQLFTELLGLSGVQVIHVVSSVHQAQLAESCGVSAIVAEGFEAAGRIGREEIPLLSLIPQVVDAVSLPVIAAGGIADNRGMDAAFELGAEGVQLGTRFVASKECLAHPNYKQAIVDAEDDDTVVMREGRIPARILKCSISAECRPHASRSRSRLAQLEGDLINGVVYAGATVGLIKDVLPAAVIVETLAKSY